MEIPFFPLFRLTFAILAGFWVVTKMRGMLRAMVVRSMPLRYRISERSFFHQTRITTLVSVVIGTLIAGGIFWGLDYLTDQARIKTGPPDPVDPPTEEEFKFFPTPEPYDTPIDTIEVDISPPAPEIAPVEETAPPRAAEPKLVAPAPRPAPLVITQETYFLQLDAFEKVENADIQQAYWERRLRRAVWVADASPEWAPYKVLVGPFWDRGEALAYRRQKKLGGYARPLGYLRLYAR